MNEPTAPFKIVPLPLVTDRAVSLRFLRAEDYADRALLAPVMVPVFDDNVTWFMPFLVEDPEP